jgi:hypothetical protein
MLSTVATKTPKFNVRKTKKKEKKMTDRVEINAQVHALCSTYALCTDIEEGIG